MSSTSHSLIQNDQIFINVWNDQNHHGDQHVPPVTEDVVTMMVPQDHFSGLKECPTTGINQVPPQIDFMDAFDFDPNHHHHPLAAAQPETLDNERGDGDNDIAPVEEDEGDSDDDEEMTEEDEEVGDDVNDFESVAPQFPPFVDIL